MVKYAPGAVALDPPTDGVEVSKYAVLSGVEYVVDPTEVVVVSK